MLHVFALGLALGATSAFHCVAMCGPLVAFAALAPGEHTTDPTRVLRYQLGRVLGYATLGAAMGALGGTIAGLVPSWAETMLSLLLGVALAVAAWQLWPRRAGALVAVGRAPRAPSLGDHLARASAALLGRVRRHPLVLGVASALLPCGVLAAGAIAAASTGSALAGAVTMAGLAVASGVAVGVAGLVLGRVEVARSPVLARTMAAALALGALVLFVRPTLVRPDSSVSCHHE